MSRAFHVWRIALLLVTQLACAVRTSAAVNDWSELVHFDSYVLDIAVDPSVPSTIYAAAGDVYKSTDGGATWGPTGAGGGLCLAIDPVVSSTVYVGRPGPVDGGVYKSVDGGATWNRISLWGVKWHPCLAIDPTNPSTLYLGTDGGGVSKSTDGGGHWGAANFGLADLDITALVLDPASPAVLYAATGSGIFKSIDAGASWTATNVGLGPNLSIYALALDPAPSTLYASTADGTFRSVDGAQSWALRDMSVVPNVFAADPSSPGRVFAGGAGPPVRTVNGWASHSSLLSPGFTDPAAVIASVALDPSAPHIVYVGTLDSTSGGSIFRIEIDLCETAADCDDGDPCTVDACDPADRYCDVAGCTHAPRPLPCGMQCSPAPLSGCRTAEKSLLLLEDNADDRKERLIWKWLRGQATSQTEFADPTTSADYAFCIYAGTTASLIAEVNLPASPVNWSALSTKGYRYDGTGGAYGIEKTILKGSAEDKSKIVMKGRGANLPDPTLGDLVPPVTAQLVNTDTGLCFEGMYDEGDIIKNDPGQFKAKTQ